MKISDFMVHDVCLTSNDKFKIGRFIKEMQEIYHVSVMIAF